MQQDSAEQSVHWSSSGVFVLATAGATIGLGNVWRLPYLAGEYGGGAFVLIYVLALVVMALPLLVAQLLLARGVRADLVTMLRHWARTSGLHRAWAVTGHLALLGAVLVLSYYSVIAGWSMAYLMRALAGGLEGVAGEGLREMFLGLVGDPERGLAWHTIFMVISTVLVAHGVRGGLEPVARWLVTAALVAVVALALVASGRGQDAALTHLFQPDFGALGWRGIVEALHQAFFSLSLGVGVILAFGAYLREDASLLRSGGAVVALDIGFALTAGFAVMALLVATGQAPATGLKLVFEALPAATSGVGGTSLSTLFFFMLVLVSLTSAVALMEPVVVWVMRRFEASRVGAATGVGMVVWLLGLGTLLSFNLLSRTTLLGRTIFDWSSQLSSRLLLPVVGLLICLFVGRFLHPARLRTLWQVGDRPRGFDVWYWLLRYPARIGLILVLLYSVGIFAFLEGLW